MKNKRILSLVLAFAMILGTFSFAFAAAPEDVVDTEYEAAVDRLIKLGALGGYPDGTFKPDNQITREEFAAALIKTKGLKTAAESATGLPSGFTDVPATRWSSGYVGLAANLGIVNGIGNDKFAPTSPVKYEQAITMIIRALGYEEAAKAKGGYPLGYLIIANDIGLLDSVKGAQGVPALRGTVAQLLDNALEIPMMIQSGYGSQTMWVVSGTANTEKQTLLDELGFKYTVGRVANASRNRITIGEGRDSVTLSVDDDFDFNYMEGLTVKAWYSGSKLVIYSELEEAIYAPAEGEDRIYVGSNRYPVAKGAFIEVDNEEVEKVEADYAKVLLNPDNEIVWLKGYTLPYTLVVSEVKDNVAYDYNKVDVNLKGYTILKDGKTIPVEDIEEEEDILLYNKDEGFAIVYNESKVGEIERVYSDSFRFEGSVYEVLEDAKYLDGEDFAELTEDVLEGMKDEEEEVEVFFNTQGEVVLVVGSLGTPARSHFYGLVTYANEYDGRRGRMLVIDVMNKEGKETSYDIRQNKKTYLGIKPAENTGERKDLIGKVVFVSVDSDENIKDITLLEPDNENVIETIKLADPYVEGYKLEDSTVIFHGDKAAVLGDVEDFTKVNNADIYVDETNRIKVIKAESTNAAKEDIENKIDLVNRVRELKNGQTEFTFINGDRYVTKADDKYNDYKDYKNKIVKLAVDKKTDYVTEADPKSKDKGITVDSRNTGSRIIKDTENTYELVSSAKLYDIRGGRAEEIKLADLAKGDKIDVYFDSGAESRFVEFVVRTALAGEEETPEEVTEAEVTYINDGLFDVTLPADAKATDTFVVRAIVGTTVKSATVVNGKADFGDAAFTDGELYTANLYNLLDLNTVIASQNFIAEIVAEYAITFADPTNGTLAAKVDGVAVISPADVKEGKDVVFTATPDAGYRVKEWTVDGTAVVGETANTFTLENVDAAATVAVTLEAVPTYAITFADPANGALKASVDGAEIATGDTVTEGKNVVFLAIPSAGYKVKEWTVGGVAVAGETGTKFTLTNVKAAATVVVVLEALPTKTVTFANPTNGTLAAKVDGTGISTGDSVLVGKDVAFTVTPDAGYRVKEWKVGTEVVAGETGNEFTLTNLTEDVTVSVVLELDI